jgi:hypothetical protein
MVDLEKSILLLLAKRERLVDQIDAIDRAVAALRGNERQGSGVPEADAKSVAIQLSDVVVHKVRPKRRLSDEHKQKLIEGRRKARQAKAVAAGDAREALSDAFRPALATPLDKAPRLVKKTGRELTTVPDHEMADALEAAVG